MKKFDIDFKYQKWVIKLEGMVYCKDQKIKQFITN